MTSITTGLCVLAGGIAMQIGAFIRDRLQRNRKCVTCRFFDQGTNATEFIRQIRDRNMMPTPHGIETTGVCRCLPPGQLVMPVTTTDLWCREWKRK